MKRFIPIVIIVCLLISIPAFAEEQKTGAFISLSTDDTCRAFMALGISNKMITKGHPVTIFLNISGVNLAAKRIHQPRHPFNNKSVNEMLQGLIKSRAKVIVCQMCIKRYGLKKEDLMDGVVVGNPDITIPAMLDKNVKVISW